MRSRTRMTTCALLVAATIGMVADQYLATSRADEQTQPATVRIGTYDNRAIAVAFAASKHNPVQSKMEEYKAAKDAGDDAKVAELETWGKDFQRKLHFQGFGHVPVDDLLAPVADQLAGVASANNLSAIVMDCDFSADGVEVLDVTDKIVALYEPSERTLKQIASLKNVEPISLLKLADMPAEH